MFRLAFTFCALVALVASKDVRDGKLLEGDVLLHEIEIKQPSKIFGYAEATTSYTVKGAKGRINYIEALDKQAISSSGDISFDYSNKNGVNIAVVIKMKSNLGMNIHRQIRIFGKENKSRSLVSANDKSKKSE